MSNSKKIASFSICGEITLNLHSLNNEGGEGNQILTRQLTVMTKDGDDYKETTVNGISGDMFKHIHVGHLVNYAKEKKLSLCSNCEVQNPNRLSSGEDLGKVLSGNYSDKDVVDKIIELCSVDDLHGVLVTKIGGKNKNVPRKSTIEFGWTVGIPGKNNTETYLHTKFVSDAGEKKTDSGNEGQNIFHRPANHGVYAFICHVEAYRIGFNDISRTYPEPDKRNDRYKALVESLLHTFLNPRGAMTSSQKPHITDFRGVVSISNKLVPAPTISPLNGKYPTEIKTIQNNLNKLEAGAIEVKDFDSLAKLSEILTDLAQNTEPYQIQ